MASRTWRASLKVAEKGRAECGMAVGSCPASRRMFSGRPSQVSSLGRVTAWREESAAKAMQSGAKRERRGQA